MSVKGDLLQHWPQFILKTGKNKMANSIRSWSSWPGPYRCFSSQACGGWNRKFICKDCYDRRKIIWLNAIFANNRWAFFSSDFPAPPLVGVLCENWRRGVQTGWVQGDATSAVGSGELTQGREENILYTSCGTCPWKSTFEILLATLASSLSIWFGVFFFFVSHCLGACHSTQGDAHPTFHFEHWCGTLSEHYCLKNPQNHLKLLCDQTFEMWSALECFIGIQSITIIIIITIIYGKSGWRLCRIHAAVEATRVALATHS